MAALLSVARARILGEPPPEIGPKVDRPALSSLASRHGLDGLVAQVTAPRGSTALAAVARNLQRVRALHELRRVLEGANVPTVSLKGPALAVQAWGDVSARQYNDIDALVPPEDSERTVKALLDAGYVDRWAQFGRAPSPANWFEWAFTAPDGETLIEVHWSLLSPTRHPGVGVAEIWDPSALESVSLPGGPVEALRPEVLIPYLALHSTEHHWGWLEFPLTLAALICRRGDTLDWDGVVDRAVRWRARLRTGVGLRLALDLTHPGSIEVPESVRRALMGAGSVSDLSDWYRQHLLQSPDTEWYRGTPALLWRALRMRDSVPERARAAWQLLFEPTRTDWAPVASDGRPGGRVLPLRRIARLLRRYRANDFS